jgi:hypothetical protein
MITLPSRRSSRVARNGPSAKLCLCGTGIGESQLACKPCWDSLPAGLKAAFISAKGTGGPALEKASEAIRTFLRKATANG